jgi:hypothetical protein
MKEKYMIVRILNILSQMKSDDSLITEPCYVIVDKDYETPDSAWRVKEKYREPHHYIVVKYYI